ncbi:hypothetical protein ATDW_15520 [Asticcacaulis sp. DW145]|uniref:Type ISP restriction-modification enzyme LLaBIII C-terminal specificity domain-containing protein n=1 Tax=Asticcacaulis currens TaxID=2984210 RepID=A0ABT5IGR0_9CAUL|nr:hypothetical protein [Asticcacaulis currens]BEV11056.1 hypothetical protein ATDW_15520 [Asticcacaulis sp. DW145]
MSGSLSESVIREAFKDLLKGWAKQSGLVFAPELRMESAQKTAVIPDGTILHDLRVPLGYWESKDTQDDLDEEIRKKRLKGYPTDNIIFENSHTAVLIQNGNEVMRAQNLKRDFPRVPLYEDFARWRDWGQTLLDLHIGYEGVEPFALTRVDTPDTRARAAGLNPTPKLKSDAQNGMITLDSETVLTGVPPEAFDYRLGNRSAIDWVLDQYKKKTPKDKTIREKFNTYRFADYKETVIDLLQRVTTVSVKTVAITEAMRAVKR